MPTLTLIPTNIVSPERPEFFYTNQWFHQANDGTIYAYGIDGSRTVITQTFALPTTGDYITQPAAQGGGNTYVFTVTDDQGEFTIHATKTGGCACGDPRKPITSLDRMESLVQRTVQQASARQARNEADAVRAAQRRQRAVQKRDAAKAERVRQRAAVTVNSNPQITDN